MTGTEDRGVAVLADDDGVTRRILTVLLQRQGLQVCLAEEGTGALELIRSRRPAVIFLDAQMPAPDGFEVCRLTREQETPDWHPLIIMITAGGQDADRLRALEVGVDEFLTKPFSPSQLSELLQRSLQPDLVPPRPRDAAWSSAPRRPVRRPA